ncbi:TSUP family transporter [Dermacoccus sp. GAS27A]|uniref:TSUP family transporter n=1 Tax=Dermacoccus sp. GAS27A TaxID=3156270 RepID=UPI003839AC13
MNDPGTLTLTLLALAAACAGWVDAVVGGGGLVQLPALMVAFPHAAPAQLLATNKLGSICGTSVSSATYLRRVRPDLRTALPLAVMAFAGSMAGAALASHIPRSAFNPIILVVLVAVGTYTLFKPSMGQLENLRHAGSRRHYATAGAIGLGVGLYDGALGPGTGSFFVFALVSLLGYRFLEASAKAKLANFATNLAALVVFIPAGAVAWRVGLVLGVANLAGGYLGARTAVSKGAGFVRAVFVVVVGAFVVKLSYDTAAQFGVL